MHSAIGRKKIGNPHPAVSVFNFIRMKPDKSFIQSPLQEGQRVSAMSEPGRQYAPYVNGGDTAALTVDLPKGGGPVALKPKKDRNGITRRILAQ